ncbi:MAG: polyprenyl synthetase family protein [Spirochaetes bacterium]|nr:polyprenyl synthetase family protein [Spirochaetota bacterium]
MHKKTKATLEEILHPIEDYLQKVDEAIPRILLEGIDIIDDGALHLFKRKGKKIRASLVLLCSGLKGEISEEVVDIAASVEIVHGASLVHDDIIDQTFLRRGLKTLSKEWGNKVAVLIGDLMYIRALQVIMNDRSGLFAPDVVAAVHDMIKGELYQMEYSNIDSISREHYFNIIKYKTAIFMGTCSKLGAMKAGLDAEERHALYNFGFNIGNAFQIVDDTLDYVEDKDKTGKDPGNDFRDGKITLPFIYLLEKASDEERLLLADCARNPGDFTWSVLKELIGKYDSINYCLKAGEEYVKKALKDLDGFPSSKYKDILFDMANFFIDRDY